MLVHFDPVTPLLGIRYIEILPRMVKWLVYKVVHCGFFFFFGKLLKTV